MDTFHITMYGKHGGTLLQAKETQSQSPIQDTKNSQLFESGIITISEQCFAMTRRRGAATLAAP